MMRRNRINKRKPSSAYLKADFDRLDQWIKNKSGEYVAVFDIGTKGARILIGPKIVPETIDKHCVYSCGTITNLGAAVKDRTLSVDSKPVQALCVFLKAFREKCETLNIKEIDAVGTAVFRWLTNRSEVLNYVYKSSGVKLETIASSFEAELTIRGLISILDKDKYREIDIRDDDVIAIADQGGGSLEVSWMRWRHRHDSRWPINSARSDKLGTTALLNHFLETGGQGKRVEPYRNRARISTQTNRVRKLAQDTIRSWMTLPRTDDQTRIHLFGVGKAITDVQSVRPFRGEYKFVETSRMNTIVEACASRYDESRQQILSIYKALKGLAGAGTGALGDRKKLQSDLSLLYGLPIFAETAKTMETDGVWVAGNGLRHGYYLWKYDLKQPHSLVPSDESGPYNFISYARTDAAQVYSELHEINDLGFRVAYDKGIAPGAHFAKEIGRMLSNCSALIVFWTKQSITRPEVDIEVQTATRMNIPIIQIFLEDVTLPEHLSYRLQHLQHIIRPDETLDTFRSRIESGLPAETRI